MSPKRDRVDGFTERLAAYRAAAGLTMEQLAQKVGVTKAAVSNWEAGAREPSLADLVALAEALEVTTDRLLGRGRR